MFVKKTLKHVDLLFSQAGGVLPVLRLLDDRRDELVFKVVHVRGVGKTGYALDHGVEGCHSQTASGCPVRSWIAKYTAMQPCTSAMALWAFSSGLPMKCW